MSQIKMFCACLMLFLACSSVNAQADFPDWLKITPVEYQDCSAILFNGEMLVNEYSPNGKCRLEQGMKGKLTLAAVTLSDEGATPTKRLTFQIAILNEKTNTMWMYSKEPLSEVLFEDVFEACLPGDAIIILTVDKRYTLPHHKIEVSMKC